MMSRSERPPDTHSSSMVPSTDSLQAQHNDGVMSKSSQRPEDDIPCIGESEGADANDRVRVRYSDEEKANFEELGILYTPDTDDGLSEQVATDESHYIAQSSMITEEEDGGRTHSAEVLGMDDAISYRIGHALQSSRIREPSRRPQMASLADFREPNDLFEHRARINAAASETEVKPNDGVHRKELEADEPVFEPSLDIASPSQETAAIQRLRETKLGQGQNLSINAARARAFLDQARRNRYQTLDHDRRKLELDIQTLISRLQGVRYRGRLALREHEPSRSSPLAIHLPKLTVTLDAKQLSGMLDQLKEKYAALIARLEQSYHQETHLATLDFQSLRSAEYQEEMARRAADVQHQLDATKCERDEALKRMAELQRQLDENSPQDVVPKAALQSCVELYEGQIKHLKDCAADREDTVKQILDERNEPNIDSFVCTSSHESRDNQCLAGATAVCGSTQCSQWHREQQHRHEQSLLAVNKTMTALERQNRNLQHSLLKRAESDSQQVSLIARLQEAEGIVEYTRLEIADLMSQIRNLEYALSDTSDSRITKDIGDHIIARLEAEREGRRVKRDNQALTLDYSDLLTRYNQCFHERNVYLAQIRNTETLADAVTQNGVFPEGLEDDRRQMHETITKLKQQISLQKQEGIRRTDEMHAELAKFEAENHELVTRNIEYLDRDNQERRETLQTIYDLRLEIEDLRAEREFAFANHRQVDTTKYNMILATNAGLLEHMQRLEREKTELATHVRDLEDKESLHLRTIEDQQHAFDARMKELVDLRAKSEARAHASWKQQANVQQLTRQLDQSQAQCRELSSNIALMRKANARPSKHDTRRDMDAAHITPQQWTQGDAENWMRQVQAYVNEQAMSIALTAGA